MTNRVLLGPEGVRISRPGVDVEDPPSLTEDHLVIDWTWPKVERLHAFGHVFGGSLTSPFTFSFTPLSYPPLAHVLVRNKGTHVYRDELVSVYGYIGDALCYRTDMAWYTTVDSVVVTVASTQGVNNFDYSILVFKP